MSDEIPQKLYHYTTSQVLTSMLQTGQLWFTDFRFLNDSKEYYFASKIIENTLEAYDFDAAEERFAQEVKSNTVQVGQFTTIVSNFRKRLVPMYFKSAEYWDNGSNVPYVFSLSEDKDSLSQWRAYGRGELCIEFDTNELKAVLGRSILGRSIVKVHYKVSNDVDTRPC